MEPKEVNIMKWEYRTAVVKKGFKMESSLNNIGQDEWELILRLESDYDGHTLIFKRPITEPTLAPPPIKD